MKKCYHCGIEKEDREFYINRSRKDGLQNRCKSCSNGWYREHPEYREREAVQRRAERKKDPEKTREKGRLQKRQWVAANREKAREYSRKNYLKNRDSKIEYRPYGARVSVKPYKNPSPKGGKDRYAHIRNEFMELYGNACSCCGESEREFLTIEHINGREKKEKKESSYSCYLSAIREYRPDLYEILCWNCNCSKGKYGYCPHKTVPHPNLLSLLQALQA